MSRERQRTGATKRLAAHLLETGLSATSLRQLATAAGVSDRMLLYYFSSKEDVLASALGAIAEDLRTVLAGMIPEGERLPFSSLLGRMATVARRDALQPYLRLWIEIVAAAARGEPPYPAVAPGLAEGFFDWVARRLDEPDADRRRAAAALILSMIDGLAIIEISAGPALADAAAGAAASFDRS